VVPSTPTRSDAWLATLVMLSTSAGASVPRTSRPVFKACKNLSPKPVAVRLHRHPQVSLEPKMAKHKKLAIVPVIRVGTSRLHRVR